MLVRIVQDALYSTAHFRARTFEGSARQPNHTLGDLAARTSRCVTIPVHFSLCVRRPSRTAGKQLSVGVSRVCGVGVVLHCAIATLCHINASPRASTQYESHVLHAKLKASVFYTYASRPYVFGYVINAPRVCWYSMHAVSADNMLSFVRLPSVQIGHAHWDIPKTIS